jgi:hypothetical protein
MVILMAQLKEVFGISTRVDSTSYVDRGGLDERFRRALDADRHIAVHGGSKQGKSWLRAKGLSSRETLLVQCTPTSTPASLFSEALGRLGIKASLSMSTSRDISGSLDFSGALELGKIVGKLSTSGKVEGAISTTTTVDEAPLGQTVADLLWVSLSIVASKKRLVLEDFHYLSESVQREFAFMLKAMGEYGLFAVIVGVWPRDHLLTYFNGDLDGRVEDIHLSWSDAELLRVLEQGSRTLNIRISTQIEQQMLRDAYGSIGLLQRLAEQLCTGSNIFDTQTRLNPRSVSTGSKYLEARTAVAAQMQGRYQTFADNFVRGMRRLAQGLEVYRYILQASTEATDEELIAGIDSAHLLQRVSDHQGGESIRASDLTQALERIDKLQLKIGVNPLVLTYNRSDRKLFLADRSFLFYRAHGNQQWPWSATAPRIQNDLYVQEPLDIDFEGGLT